MEINKLNKYSVPEEPAQEQPFIDSAFIFVGFGWKFKDSFVFKFDPEEMFPDEAYLKALESYLSIYPYCSSSVYYLDNTKKDFNEAIFYSFYDIYGKNKSGK